MYINFPTCWNWFQCISASVRFLISVINWFTPADIRFPLIYIGLLGLLQHMVNIFRLFWALPLSVSLSIDCVIESMTLAISQFCFPGEVECSPNFHQIDIVITPPNMRFSTCEIILSLNRIAMSQVNAFLSQNWCMFAHSNHLLHDLVRGFSLTYELISEPAYELSLPTT
jgi:hypothetical protein